MAKQDLWQWWIARAEEPPLTLAADLRPSLIDLLVRLYVNRLPIVELYQEDCRETCVDPETLNNALIWDGLRPKGSSEAAPRIAPVPVYVQAKHTDADVASVEDLWDLLIGWWSTNFREWWKKRGNIEPDFFLPDD